MITINKDWKGAKDKYIGILPIPSFEGREMTQILNTLEKQNNVTRMTKIWLSPSTYRKLLQVERELVAIRGCKTNPDEAIREIIEFWRTQKPMRDR